jgi:hypothetical protein
MTGRRALLGLLAAGALAPLVAAAQPAAIRRDAGTPPEERRAFNVDGTDVLLPPPSGLGDAELTDFLRAIKRGAVVWRPKEPPLRRLVLGEIDFVGVSGSPRLYHVFVVPPNRAATAYVYDAEFDGRIVTIVRWAVLRR